MRTQSRWILAAVAILAAPLGAQARSSYLSAFNTRYGTANTKLDSCSTCHAGSTSTWNPYGTDVKNNGAATNIDAALGAVEPLDSDGDKFSNIDEIHALTLPGDKADYPVVVAYCPDADGDGYAVCNGTCTLPAGKQCGDCDDANKAVNPGVTEICSNGIDDNCDGLVDAKDPICAPTALSDFDIASVRATGRTAVGRKASFKVNVVQVVPGTASLTVQVTENGVTTTLGTVSPLAAGTYGFVYRPTISGTLSWSATIADEDPDADVATATTTVK
jgi:putative metal-binding protein